MKSAERVEIGAPSPLFEIPGRGLQGYTYDVAPDGQRFVVVRPKAAINPGQLIVTLGWMNGLELRGAAPKNTSP